MTHKEQIAEIEKRLAKAERERLTEDGVRLFINETIVMSLREVRYLLDHQQKIENCS